MAIKIIKNGELPMIEKKCECCGCEFKFDLREVEREVYGYPLYSVKCPYCGMNITLEEADFVPLGLVKIKSTNG